MRMLCLAPLLILCSAVSFAGTQVANDPGEPGVITGKVVNSDGHPLRDARVYVREHNLTHGAIRYVTTGQNGEFRIANLRPGDYDVFAVPSHSTSMITRWSQRVHLPEDKPIGKVIIRVGSPNIKSSRQQNTREADSPTGNMEIGSCDLVFHSAACCDCT
jgi:protocatechuate 3,4-dioxygenase beta subunit